MGDHPAKNGRSGQGQENDPLVSLCRSHLSPFIDCQWLFYKIESYSSRKNACFSTFIPGKSHAVLELADGTSIDLGETAVRGQMQGGHWEVRSDSLKYCEEGVKGGEEYHTLKVPRGGEYTLVLADGSKVF